MKQAAGSVSLFLGLGFGLPCFFAIRHFAQTGEVWTFMGFPTGMVPSNGSAYRPVPRSWSASSSSPSGSGSHCRSDRYWG